MTEIVKTKAIILRGIDFGDTSRIGHFFTEDFGKVSAIIKGVRSPKSKIGSIIDTLNIVELILYKKETREMQFVSQVDLVKHFARIRDDYNKYQFASAIIELLFQLTMENEEHRKLFEGTIKILTLIDDTKDNPKLLFVKYFLFFLKEIGYEFQLEQCNICNRKIQPGEAVSYNYEAGLICSECRVDRLTNFNFDEELFKLLLCLNTKKNNISYKEESLDILIRMLEKFITYQHHEFKGLRSLKNH